MVEHLWRLYMTHGASVLDSVGSMATRKSTEGQWVTPLSPARPKEIVLQFDRTDVKRLYKAIVAADSTAMEELFQSLAKPLIARLANRFLKDLKKDELKRLIAYSYTIETDPERLKKLREAMGEKEYACYIIWLINRPFDSLPEAYKEVEIELYKLARYSSDVFVLILDYTKYPATVIDLMNALDIDALPALILSATPIDLVNPRKENTIVFKSGAIERMVKQGKLIQFISNIPVWARMGVLKDKARWEGEIKPFLAELWDQIKSLISVNI